MNGYARHLLTDSTFIRFSNMSSMEEPNYIYTAYEVMQDLSSKLFSLMNLPLMESPIYLSSSGNVISASQFTPAEQYYSSYRAYQKNAYQDWLQVLQNAEAPGRFFSVAPFGGESSIICYALDINSLSSRKVPAVVWFELNASALRLPGGYPGQDWPQSASTGGKSGHSPFAGGERSPNRRGCGPIAGHDQRCL